MHTNVILTNKRRTHAQSNYTNTKLKAWFRRFLCHPVRKWSGSILPPGPTRGDKLTKRFANLANAVQRNGVKVTWGKKRQDRDGLRDGRWLQTGAYTI